MIRINKLCIIYIYIYIYIYILIDIQLVKYIRKENYHSNTYTVSYFQSESKMYQIFY
jgi:hypothetical protein